MTSNKHVVGIDLSLDSTGIAIHDGQEVTTHRIQTKPKATGPLVKTKRGMTASQTYGDKLTRFLLISHRITRLIPDGSTVYLEGPSYASTGASVHDIAGNWWLLLQRLDEMDCTVTIVPPTTLKKYATGKGNSAKDAVLAAVIRRYMDITITGNDVADAVALMAIGCRLHGRPLEDTLPAAHLHALDTLGDTL